MFLLVGTVIAVAGMIAIARGDEILSGVALILTGLVVPTYFGYVVSLASLVLGVIGVVRGVSRRTPRSRTA